MAKAKFFMQKQGETLQFIGPKRDVYESWVKGLKDKQVVEAVFSKRRHAKTNPQLGYWYAVLMPFAASELQACGYGTLFDTSIGEHSVGVETNDKTVDLLFKTLFCANKSLGATPQKRNMTDEEMSQLIDFTVNWLAENLGVVAPPPTKEELKCQAITK